jgi:hypothetical protein
MERDFTGKMAQNSSQRIMKLRQRMSERIPYGPMRSFLSKPEQRQKLQNMNPQAKLDLMNQIGEEEWQSIMEKLYGNQSI